MGIFKERNRNPEEKFLLSKSLPWRFFSSLYLTVTLILILVMLSLIGIFVIQAPPEIKANAADYGWWLENIAGPNTGFWYPLMQTFGFFDVFHSICFLGAGLLLIINIIVCSLNRLKQTRTRVSLTQLRQDEEYFEHKSAQITFLSVYSTVDADNIVTRELKKLRYKVTENHNGDTISLAADKNRYSPWGTYLIHLSVILFVGGFLIGSYLGFRDSSFVVPEGVTRDLGHNTNLALQLISFSDEYWPDGPPKDYRSEVVIFDSGSEVKREIIRVNHPFSYKGIRIYQSFFGPAVSLQIKDTAGSELFKGNIALSGILETHPYQRPSGGFTLTQEEYSIFLVGRATNLDDSVLLPGQIGLEVYKNNIAQPVASSKINIGEPFLAGDLEFTYQGDTRFSGFQISRDPGNNLIWLASFLLIVGLVTAFYFPRRKIWLRIQPESFNKVKIQIRTDTRSKQEPDSEAQRLINHLLESEICQDKKRLEGSKK
jgi:cytochrome c biogenesis protein